jgi:hypothetical protein
MVVLLVACNLVVNSVVVLLVMRELLAAITGSRAVWSLRLVSELFLENFLGGEKWMTILPCG